LIVLKEIGDANLVESANQQQRAYRGSDHTLLEPEQQVLLSNPYAGKLDTHWTGPWTVKQMKGFSTKGGGTRGAKAPLKFIMGGLSPP